MTSALKRANRSYFAFLTKLSPAGWSKLTACNALLVGAIFARENRSNIFAMVVWTRWRKIADSLAKVAQTRKHADWLTKVVQIAWRVLNPIRPGLFSRSPGPGGLRGPDAKNQG